MSAEFRGTVDWQDISTAPKDGTEVLLWDGFSVFKGFNNWSFSDGKRHDCWSTDSFSSRPWTSHWMPLPPPPKIGEDHG